MGDNRDASDAILEDAIFLFSVCEYCGPVAIVLIGCLACLSLFQNKVVTEWRVLILERERKIKVFRTSSSYSPLKRAQETCKWE